MLSLRSARMPYARLFRFAVAPIALATFLPLCFASYTQAEDAAADTQPRNVRTIWRTNPATSAIISWETTGLGEGSLVKVRPADSQEWTTVECHRNEQYAAKLESGPAPFVHHAQLTGLTPATKHQIVCQTSDQESREFYFFTAPGDDRPVALLFGGDSRSGLKERQEVNRMIDRLVTEQTAAKRPAIIAFAHGGDFIVDGKKLDQWLRWLADHQQTGHQDGRLLPLIPTRGNHDAGPLYNQVFDFAEDNENYFATNLTSQIRIATLNTEASMAGDQRDWLENELKAERWDHRWYLAQYHRPAFPAVKLPSGALINWVPLFDQYSLDLVCEADGHNIKRTPPIRNLKIDKTGVVYIGEGGLGVGQRTPLTHRWYLQPTAEHCSSGHHLHLLTFDKVRLNVKVIRLNGELFDEFNLEPRTRPAKTASAKQAKRELVAQ